MNSKEALLLSKIQKKGNPQLEAKVGTLSDIKVPTADVGSLADLKLPTAKTGQIGPSIPSANTLGSLAVLKATKASDVPKKVEAKQQLEGEVTLGPTEVQRYSPIKTYLKKKGK